MASRSIELHPSAIDEAESAYAWYRLRSPAAAAAFIAELDRAIATLSESPHRWPEYVHGTRRYLLRRFPFYIVYRDSGDIVQIIAVAHGRRRPGYWKARAS